MGEPFSTAAAGTHTSDTIDYCVVVGRDDTGAGRRAKVNLPPGRCVVQTAQGIAGATRCRSVLMAFILVGGTRG